MDAGRPPITLNDLPPGWASSILSMYAKGCSDVEVVVALGISRNTFLALIKREPEFMNTVTRGREAAEAWWMKKGRTSLENRDFNGNLYALQMRNRFGWNKPDKAEGTENVLGAIEVRYVQGNTADPATQAESSLQSEN